MTDQQAARILIIEDEPMLALGLEDLLVESGFKVAGVAGKLSNALAIIGLGKCDAAIVDANLAGVSASPAGAALTANGLPFIVLSGYSAEQHCGAFPGATLFLQKPCVDERIIEALNSILAPETMAAFDQ